MNHKDKELKTLLPKIKKDRVMFYLDAHWRDKWPLKKELKEIAIKWSSGNVGSHINVIRYSLKLLRLIILG